ncbi:unnamed protein product [Brassica rapa]|uniref:Uncharacterized protein n=1 Tax=Brassica campestris TaxID=3711 RepID=A0A3P6AA71_BRACM|nr:unnamed protein product [Brassica rapa]VDC88757.1 unnamed protein product [Brassica rapa]
MGLGLILDSAKDDEPDPYTRGYGSYLVSDPICFFFEERLLLGLDHCGIKITFA